MLARTREAINYRELLKNLVMRDLKVRYRNSFLGVLWSLLNPLLMMAVYVFVFTQLLKGGTPPEPLPGATLGEVQTYMIRTNFPVFILIGLLPWNWLATSVMGSITSIVGNAHLIKKVYFPRELLPLSLVISNLVNFLLALPVLFGLILLMKPTITLQYLWLPAILLTQTVFLAGLAFFLSAVSVYFRDTFVILEVVILAWFFLTPIFYDIKQVWPEWADWIYRLNPMASLISNYRDILFWGAPPDPAFVLRTFLTAVLVFLLGYLVFARTSRSFGELL